MIWLTDVTQIQKEQIFNVFLSAFMPQGRSTIEELTDYFNNKMVPRFEAGQLVGVALDKDRIVGFTIFQKWEGKSYYLAEMAIDPKFQGRGIGKELVMSVFNVDKTADKILLITDKDNKWSQGFYNKIGFKPSSFRYPGYPENFIGYELSISSK